MVVIGYHASHEQLPPSALFSAVRLAESVGFDAAMCSDHLAPWGRSQGESGFAWSWIGATLAVTRLPIGLVTAPGQRYHPVVLAQAVATLAEMFPGRFWAALGSGEAVNEHVTGDVWPAKDERQRRLEDSVDVIRRLLQGERVSADGRIRVHQARVWSLPDEAPPLMAAAVGPETAARAASWADGLVTVGTDPDAAGAVVEAYREAGGRGPVALQMHVSLADSQAEAMAIARDQWRHAAVAPPLAWNIEQPEDFDALAQATDGELRSAVVIAGSASEVVDRVAEAATGFDRVYLHHVGQEQGVFLRRAGAEILPALKERLGR